MEIAAPALEGRTQCLTLGRIRLMLEIAVVPVEMVAAAAAVGSELVAEEVEGVVHLALQNLPATLEAEGAKSPPSSQKVSFQTFLQDLQYFD
jgi:hypothetical protein